MSFSKGIQRLSRTSLFFESHIVYVGHYKELDRENTIKIGHSKDILDRIKRADYHGRMAMGYLLALPTEPLMRGTEQGIKSFIQAKNLVAHGKEYICPIKLSRLFHLPKAWSAEEGVHAITCLLVEALADESIHVVRVLEDMNDEASDDSSVGEFSHVMPVGFPAGTIFELLPSDFDYTSSFRALPNFEGLRHEFKDHVSREQELWKRKKVTEETKRTEKEFEFRRIEIEARGQEMDLEIQKAKLELKKLDREIMRDILRAGSQNGPDVLSRLVDAYKTMQDSSTKRKREELFEGDDNDSDTEPSPSRNEVESGPRNKRVVVDTDIYRTFVSGQFRFVGKGRAGLPMDFVKQSFEAWCLDPQRNLKDWFEAREWETHHLIKLTDEFWRDRTDKPVGGRWELTHYGSRRKLEGFSGWESVQYVSCKLD